MNLEILTARPERAHNCKACHWDTWLQDDAPPAHTCRSRPATPRTTLQAMRQDANAVFLKQELEIRERTMARINMAMVRRGRG